MKNNKRVLVACERSQVVTRYFRILSIPAYSCDLLPCSGGRPEWHLQTDAIEQLQRDWAMIIAFPPCDHLASCGARFFKEKRLDGRQPRAAAFFMKFVQAKCPKIVIENPVGIMSNLWRKPDQIINPWQFGDPFSKRTCLWLKGVDPLKPTEIVDKGKIKTYKSGNRMPEWYSKPPKNKWSEMRAKTFEGIAKAMAFQWGIKL